MKIRLVSGHRGGGHMLTRGILGSFYDSARAFGPACGLLGLVAVSGCSNPPDGPDYSNPGAGGAEGVTSAGPGTGSVMTGSDVGAGGASGGSDSATTGQGTVTSTTSGTGGTGGSGSGGQGGSTSTPDGGKSDAGQDLSGVRGHPDPNMVYPKRDGFTLYLVEEFNQAIDLRADPIWTYSDGGLPEGNVRFVAGNISFSGGKLVITATKQTVAGSFSYAENGMVFTKPLASGEFRTKFNNFRYGRYEARLKAPNQNGNFINTMFAFRTPKYQDWREIDVEVTGDKPGSLTTNVIWGNNQQAWSPGIEEPANQYPSGAGAMPLPAGFNNRTAFHTYAFEWTAGVVRWYIDDVLVRVKMNGVGPNSLPVPEKSAKIMMNLWIFPSNGFGGDPSLNTYPMTTEYEWFRFYKWNNDQQYPCPNPPTCLPADDKDVSKNNPDDG